MLFQADDPAGRAPPTGALTKDSRNIDVYAGSTWKNKRINKQKQQQKNTFYLL